MITSIEILSLILIPFHLESANEEGFPWNAILIDRLTDNLKLIS